MTWLDAIEKARLISRRWGTMPEDVDRMARVIRAMSRALKNMPHDHGSKPQRDCYVCGLLKELPPDAKEVIDEYAAKSST